MIKKSMTILSLVAVVLLTTTTVYSQGDSKEYTMLESIMLTPDNTKLKLLGDNMRTHNATYHKQGPYDASVYSITTGPNSGNIIWMMGPMMFKHNDSRPEGGGHDEDWRDNIMPYIKTMHTVEYWRMDDELSNMAMMDEDPATYKLIMVRYHEVAKGQEYNLNSFLDMVGKTIKGMDGDNPWGVYYNEFRQGNLGRHIATVGFMKNWAEFDEDRLFKKTFNKVHGENKWQNFIEMGDNVFSNSWDEIWTYNAYMSGK